MEPMPARPQPAAASVARVIAASVLWVVLLLIGILAGILVADALSSCNRPGCESGLAIGGLVGGVVGALVAGVLGRIIGLRWWWGGLALVLALGAYGLLSGLPLLGVAVVVAAPVVAGLVSEAVAGRRIGLWVPRVGVRVWLPLVVVIACVVGAGVWWEHSQAERTVQRLDATGVVPYAPTGVKGVRIVLPSGSAGRLDYLVELPQRDGLRVSQSRESVSSRCLRLKGMTCDAEVGHITVVRSGGRLESVLLDTSDSLVDLRPTSPSTSAWTEAELVEIAKQFRPTSARWLVERG